ncbi:Adenylate cyclase [Diplonema papillatum]|nr:Adenylate cyclase [Diplonema papillatum]
MLKRVLEAARRARDSVVLPTDDEVTALRKTMMLQVTFLCAVAGLVATVANTHYLAQVSGYAVVWHVVLSIGSFCYIFFKKSATHTELQFILGGYLSTVILLDLNCMVYYDARAWPLVVLVLDMVLVCRMHDYVTFMHVGIMVIWILITFVEETSRFGLLDVWGGDEMYVARRKDTDCEFPPCKVRVSAGITLVALSLTVFFIDYFITRGFAKKVLSEKTRIAASIEAADSIARALAEFDLETAEEDLRSAEGLPPALERALRVILTNLRAYRPFLPDALFDDLHSQNAHFKDAIVTAQPPGITTGSACLVFTDIVGSTAAWEACPEGMKKGLKVHNQVIRDCSNAHRGYEVKTIGDAFMMAFEKVEDAVNFGLAVQKKLCEVTWPAALLEVPHCSKDEEGLWAGLKVRIGVHRGEVDVELNSITGRVDYFGHTVNKAARLENVCVGGFVCLSQELLSSLNVSHLERHATVSVGLTQLKGVQDQANVLFLVPEHLKNRKRVIGTEVKKQEESKNNQRFSGKALLYAEESVANQSNRGSDPWEMASGVGSSAGGKGGNLARDVVKEKMERLSRATVATLQVDVDYETMDSYDVTTVLNDRLYRICGALDRSEGSIIAVVGGVIITGWNTSRRTSAHFESSLRFVGLLFRSLKHEPILKPLHVGLSTGPAFSGNVGNNRQRFVTVASPCIFLSHQLSQAASALSTFALYTAMSHFLSGIGDDFQRVIRPVDILQHGSPCLVYEVDAENLKRAVLNKNLLSESEETSAACWSQDYWKAFTARDHQLIREMAITEGDPVLSKVAHLLQYDLHLCNSPTPLHAEPADSDVRKEGG